MNAGNQRWILWCLVAAICLVAASTANAQDAGRDISQYYFTSRAAQYCQDKKFDLAVMYSDSSVNSTESTGAYAWYVRGFIFKELYKSAHGAAENNRASSVEALMKCKELQLPTESFASDAILKYLANTYYNDALILTESGLAADCEEADKCFSNFSKLITIVDPGYDIRNAAYEYYMQKAQGLYNTWSSNPCDMQLFGELKQAYELAAASGTDECDSHYNSGIADYNVALLKRSGSPTLTACIEKIDLNLYFSEALKNFEKAFAICPERQDVCRALLNTHKALGNKDEIINYTKKLESLNR